MKKKFNKKKYLTFLHTANKKEMYFFYKPTGDLEKDILKFRLWTRRFASDYLKNKDAQYHLDIIKDLVRVGNLEIDEIGIFGARALAKTALVKLWVAYSTIYKIYSYGAVVSAKKGNAINFVTDVYKLLNRDNIIYFYGDLFAYESNNKKKKTMSVFDTTKKHGGVRLQAFSSTDSFRGALIESFRPDLYIGDDIENKTTLASLEVKTPKIWELRDENVNAMELSGRKIINLGNYLSVLGNNHKIIEKLKKQKKPLMVLPIVNGKKVIWEDKFVLTKKEEFEKNKKRILENKKKGRENKNLFVSIETLKEGTDFFEEEYLCQPAKFGDTLFKRELIYKNYVKKDIVKFLENDYTEDVLKIWEEPVEDGVYGIGADTSEGKEQDSNTAVIIRYDVSPFRVVATYKSDTIPPDDFGSLIADFWRYYNSTGVVAPEINNTGFAVMAILKREMEIDYIYQMENVASDEEEKSVSTLGWRTTASSKILGLTNLRKLLYKQQFEIYDMDLIDELVSYTRKDRNSSTPLPTRHFDLFIAFMIASMLKDAEVYSGFMEIDIS